LLLRPAREKNFPDAEEPRAAWDGCGRPSVEIADDADTFGAGRPDGKVDAADTFEFYEVAPIFRRCRNGGLAMR